MAARLCYTQLVIFLTEKCLVKGLIADLLVEYGLGGGGAALYEEPHDHVRLLTKDHKKLKG